MSEQSAPAPAAQDLELIELDGSNPEDVLIDGKGNLFVGVEDGRILYVDPEKGTQKTITNTGGRPLGIEFLSDNRLVVCDSDKGLLAITIDTGDIEQLTTTIDGIPMKFCNNATVAKDGSIYFSDSSTRYSFSHSTRDIIQHVATGRLFKRDATGTVTQLLDGLQFANGVVLSPQEDFAIVAQTGGSCLTRVWLEGDKQGQSDDFVQHLPGLPDNLSVGSDGLVWVAIPAANGPDMIAVHKAPLWIRKLVSYIPERLLGAPRRYLRLLAYDFNGVCMHDLTGDKTLFTMVTGIREKDGWIYLGSIQANQIARLRRPEKGFGSLS